MDTEFFLASNSGRGFYSLYDGFPEKGSFLHIIKGGPGTGKSGFMRRLAKEAEKRGMDRELILCSGDPDSLDGLYIPELKQAWMDGTAPHVREPGLFGVDSDYVNLGAFCAMPLPEAEAAEARRLNREYKRLYSSAYSFLAAEAAVAGAYEPEPLDGHRLERLEGIIADILAGELKGRRKGEGRSECRFVSAISCKGKVRLNSSINKLCKQYYYFAEPLHAHQLLSLTAQLAERCGTRAILCPEPLRPERLECLLLPEPEICFAASGEEGGSAGMEIGFGGSCGTREGKLQESPIKLRLREQATALLQRAKALHDELEGLYKPFMDFRALDEFTDEYADKLFR